MTRAFIFKGVLLILMMIFIILATPSEKWLTFLFPAFLIGIIGHTLWRRSAHQRANYCKLHEHTIEWPLSSRCVQFTWCVECKHLKNRKI